MSTIRRYLNILGLIIIASVPIVLGEAQAASVKPLKTAVIKSTTGLCQKGSICHKDQAGVWTPSTKVAILGASIAEQADITLYVDIEVSIKTGVTSRARGSRRARPEMERAVGALPGWPGGG